MDRLPGYPPQLFMYLPEGKMENRLTKKEFLSVSLMLFAMFFGSGNLIFPPMLGNRAGTAMVPSMLGFSITAVLVPVLGILAVAKTNGVQKLGERVGPLFAIIYPAVIFLAIGPGIAIPRNGSLAFEMSVLPYLSESSSVVVWRIVYTVAFFALGYYLSLTPSKLVDRMGKLMTPVLLALIVVFYFGAVLKIPAQVAGATEEYAKPILKGFLKGYDTMDALAALNFGLVIALTIRSYQVTQEREVIKYASGAGLIAGVILFVVYAMLAHVGQIASLEMAGASNGGQILFQVTEQVFGPLGAVVLILIFTLACLTTVVGLITSVSAYFEELFDQKISYKAWATIFTLTSLVLANFGLDWILGFSVPILVAIYPAAIVLILMALFQDVFHFRSLSYKVTVYVVLFLSILQGLKVANVEIPFLHQWVSYLPFSADGLEWALPALLMIIICAGLGERSGKDKRQEAI